MECVVKVLAKGKVAKSTDACLVRTSSATSSLDIVNGTVKVNSSGKVRGQLCLSNNCHDFIDARMTQNKQLIDGIGITESNFLFSFSAVKR